MRPRTAILAVAMALSPLAGCVLRGQTEGQHAAAAAARAAHGRSRARRRHRSRSRFRRPQVKLPPPQPIDPGSA